MRRVFSSARMAHWLVLLLVILSTSLLLTACEEEKEATLKNVELAHGYSQGEAVDPSTTYKTTDKSIHTVIQMGGKSPSGAKLKVNWLAVDTADGARNKSLQQKEVIVSVDNLFYDFVLNAPEGSGFATGKYQADVSINGTVEKTLYFTVQ
ncbi:MAG TPA: hypothetical protein VH186_25430 [Chloroflexia bacterium]|nr:hypothetical protein [Chloroflexia bacterium]